MTTVGYRSPSYGQLAAEQRPGPGPLSTSLAGPPSIGASPTLPPPVAADNPTLYTRNAELDPGATRVAGRNVPWSAPSNIYRQTESQTILDTNSHLEDAEDAYRLRAARLGVPEHFAPVPTQRFGQPLGVLGAPAQDQQIRRAQWLPPAVRYPSVNLVQRTVYGTSDPVWRRSFTPVDYAGLWAYQQDAMAWRRRHAAQLAYLRCHPAVCGDATRRVRYQDSRENPLGA